MSRWWAISSILARPCVLATQGNAMFLTSQRWHGYNQRFNVLARKDRHAKTATVYNVQNVTRQDAIAAIVDDDNADKFARIERELQSVKACSNIATVLVEYCSRHVETYVNRVHSQVKDNYFMEIYKNPMVFDISLVYDGNIESALEREMSATAIHRTESLWPEIEKRISDLLPTILERAVLDTKIGLSASGKLLYNAESIEELEQIYLDEELFAGFNVNSQFSREKIIVLSGFYRQKIRKWLDELTREEKLELIKKYDGAYRLFRENEKLRKVSDLFWKL